MLMLACLLTFVCSASAATVEFPFQASPETPSADSAAADSAAEDSAAADSAAADSAAADSAAEDSAAAEPSPLLQVLRDFLFQARDGLLDPQGATEQTLLKVFEETTTMLINQVPPDGVLNRRMGDVLPNEDSSGAKCSECSTTLQSCVQRCFQASHCKERNVCPPPPSRICSPFSQWSDECRTHHDCKDALCCNDGCANKCVPFQ